MRRCTIGSEDSFFLNGISGLGAIVMHIHMYIHMSVPNIHGLSSFLLCAVAPELINNQARGAFDERSGRIVVLSYTRVVPGTCEIYR